MRTELIQALKTLKENQPEGTEQALALIQETVFSFSMKLCGNREDAEDVMQETLVRLLPYLRRFDRPEALALWLYKVSKTQCLMSRRQSKFAPRAPLSIEQAARPTQDSLKLAIPRPETPEGYVLRKEKQKVLQRALRQLPPAYRTVLVLHDMEALATAQIATLLGLREGTVRVRLHRARLFIRQELEKVELRRPAGGAPPLSGQCRKLMAQLSEYLDHRLSGELCGEVEKHLKRCPRCRELLAGLERTVEECRRYQCGEADPDCRKRSRELLMKEYRRVLADLRGQ